MSEYSWSLCVPVSHRDLVVQEYVFDLACFPPVYKIRTFYSLSEMALASGHWVEKETEGMPASPRSGHAVAVAGNIAFVHGGVSSSNSQNAQAEYLNDFYMMTVSSSCITWEMMPQNGVVPAAREGHTLCIVGGKIYLFGGSCNPEAKECLPGVHCFDVVPLRWEKPDIRGVAARTLRHSSAVLGDNIYVYGGILDGTPTDDLMMFSTVSLIWTPIKASGTLPSARYNHMCAVVNAQIFLFGGCDADGSYYKDIHVLNIETLTWKKIEVKGESPLSCAGQTFTAHHDKDIYLFGGMIRSADGTMSSTNEIHKLSLAKMKWKVPLYVGIPPATRHGHAAFIIHSHMYVFAGRNEDQEFNDLKIMRLINPSERQPVMKEILSEFGLQDVRNSFVPTKVPNVRYELSETPVNVKIEKTESAQPTAHQEFITVRAEALTLIHQSFAILDEQFRKLDREKSDVSEAMAVLRCERQAIDEHHLKQSQELRKMLERHRLQNEAWLRARAEENDRERRELFKLREEVLHEQEKLKEEQCNIQKRSEHLLSIMQQFKGM